MSGNNNYDFTITYNATSVVLTFTPNLKGRKPPGHTPKPPHAATGGPPEPQGVVEALAALVGPHNPSAGLLQALPTPAAVAVSPHAQAGLSQTLTREEAITAIARAGRTDGHTHPWTALDLALSDPGLATDLAAAFLS
jgi:hypothetical protein